MTNDAIPPPPFWPSRRLWLKLLWAAICVPLLFYLLIISFVGGLFSSAWAVLFFSILVGASVIAGLLLAPTWRGAGAGLLAMIGMVLVWNIAGNLVYNAPYLLSESLPLTLSAGSGVSIIELVTREVRGRRGLVGLGVGIIVSLLLSLAYAHIFLPIYTHGPMANNLFLIGWSAHFALVWLSVFFFPELLTRRVGWGGVIVWAGLVGLVFGVSFMLMK